MHIEHPKGLAIAAGGVLGAGALAGLMLWRARRGKLGEPLVAAITINKPPDEVYRQWIELDRVEELMRDVDAQITEDIPGRTVSWRSTTKDIPLRGCATFNTAPQGRGTELVVEMQMAPLARLFTLPGIVGELRRFKQILELGEVVQ